MTLCMLLTVGIVELVYGLRRVVFREISRPSIPHSALLLLVTTINLLITSLFSDTVIVYTLGGELVHEFGGRGYAPGKFHAPLGICVDDSGAVYIIIADDGNCRVQVF